VICDVVVDALGRELVVIQAYPDGSYNCPSCHYAVQAHEPHCQNPACFTRPGYPAADQAKREAEEVERKRAEAQRRRDHELAIQRHDDEVKRRLARDREIIAAAEASGACVRCALESVRYGRPLKLTKHRKACPRAR
jgi:hypothetical protein